MLIGDCPRFAEGVHEGLVLGEEGPEGAAKEPGVGSKLKEEIEEEVAEHFSSDKWHAPKNPFKGKGKRK